MRYSDRITAAEASAIAASILAAALQAMFEGVQEEFAISLTAGLFYLLRAGAGDG